MATEFFAKIGDIQGESQDARHKGEIQFTAWSWGVAQTASTAPVAGGAGAGKPNFSEFHFTHAIDKASPNLLKACATGQHIKEATITMRKAGGGQQEFLTIKMNDVIVTGMHETGSSGEGLLETVSLQCGKVAFEYRPQKPDGSLDAAVTFSYDIRSNKEA